MSRLWRLDIGESVMDIEKGINNDYQTAISVRGRVLEKNEVLYQINVSDSDCLLYEIKVIQRNEEMFII